jgi:hypothetical protein
VDGTDPEGSDIRLLREVTVAAATVFTEPPRQAAAITYLRQRGIDAPVLSPQWVIGYAPPRWPRLVDRLCPEFSEQALLNAGVARRCSRGTLIGFHRLMPSRHAACSGVSRMHSPSAAWVADACSGMTCSSPIA